MDPILQFARAHGLFVIEDAAQAHGAGPKAEKRARWVTWVASVFIPEKIVGAFGEAGAVVTSDPELRKQIQVLRDHGQSQKYYHTWMGWNCRMDGIQAAVLSIKLRYFDEANLLRRKHALGYNQALTGIGDVLTPLEARYARHVYHVYAVQYRNATQCDENCRKRESGALCIIPFRFICRRHAEISATKRAHSRSQRVSPNSFFLCRCFQN